MILRQNVALPSGGYRKNAKRPLKYGEATELVPVRVPKSKKKAFKKMFKEWVKQFEKPSEKK